jgi:hypothetical protein
MAASCSSFPFIVVTFFLEISEALFVNCSSSISHCPIV